MEDPILVSGCARSGTSLVAQILHVCGAWKGETVAPDPASNPDGFFEHADRVAIAPEFESTKKSYGLTAATR